MSKFRRFRFLFLKDILFKPRIICGHMIHFAWVHVYGYTEYCTA